MPSQEQAAPSPAPGRRSGLFRRFVVSYCLLLVVLWVPLFVLADVRMSEGLRDQARERGLAIARSLAALSQPSLVAYDTLAVAQGAARAKRQSGLTDVVVFDKEGRIAAHTEAGWLQGQPPTEPDLLRAARTPVVTVSEVEMAPAAPGGRPVPGLEIVVPVYLDEGSAEKWGAVRVRLSTEEIHARIRSTRLGLLGLGLLALAVGVLGSFVMARRITKPLSGLVAGALRAARGDLESRIEVHTGDEIEELAGSFNHMIEEVEQKQRAIAELNRGLEEKVRVRTEDLTQAKGDLERAYEELSQAEMNLIHSEKMASLGQLVAGIAHEINTPSSAIGAAVYNLADDLRALPGQVRVLVDEGLPAAESEPLFALIARALTPEPGRRSSTADIRQRTRSLEASLSAAGLDEHARAGAHLHAPRLCRRAAGAGRARAARPGRRGLPGERGPPGARGPGRPALDRDHHPPGQGAQGLLAARPGGDDGGGRPRRDRDDAHHPAQPDPLRRRGRAPLRDRAPGHGQRPRAEPGLDEPHPQRPAGHGRERPTHHRDLAGGFLRGRAHHRQRSRHPRGHPRPHLRPLLHHQGPGRGHRAGARHRPADRPAPSRADPRRLPARAHQLRGPAADGAGPRPEVGA